MTPGSSLIHLVSVDSTNLELKRLQQAQAVANGTILLADHQSQGHGRNHHTWESKAGDNLLFSTWIGLDVPPAELAGYPLLPAVAVTDVLCGLGVDARCKWPNDIRIKGCKVGGILIECVTASNGRIKGAIIGIGINIRSCPEDTGMHNTPTCLARHMAALPQCEALARLITQAITGHTRQWLAGGRAAIIREWEKRCDHLGKPVHVTRGGDKELMLSEGVTDTGNLLARIDGRTVELHSEEIIAFV